MDYCRTEMIHNILLNFNRFITKYSNVVFVVAGLSLLEVLVFGFGCEFFQACINIIRMFIFFTFAISCFAYGIFRAEFENDHDVETGFSAPQKIQRLQFQNQNVVEIPARYLPVQLSLPFQQGSLLYLIRLLHSSAEPIPKEEIKVFMPVLKALVYHPDDTVLVDALNAIKSLAEFGHRQSLIDNTFIDDIIPLMLYDDLNIQKKIMEALSHFANGTSKDVEHLVKCGTLDFLDGILRNSNVELKILALRFLYYMAVYDVEAIIDANLVQYIMVFIRDWGKPYQQAAVQALTNLIIYGNTNHLDHLLTYNFIPALSKVVFTDDILRSFLRLLRNSSPSNRFRVALLLRHCGAITKLTQMKGDADSHSNDGRVGENI